MTFNQCLFIKKLNNNNNINSLFLKKIIYFMEKYNKTTLVNKNLF